jgi:integrase
VVGERGNSKSTAWTYEQNLRRYERVVGRDAATATLADVRYFLRCSNYHPSTKNGTLVAVRCYLKYGLLEGWADPVETAKILTLKGPKGRRQRKRGFSLNQVHEILEACRTPLEKRVGYLGFYQGLRISDQAQLRREHFLADRLAFVSIKGDKYLELPLHREVLRVKDEILMKEPTRDALKHTVRSLSHYTGIPFTSHRFRHTFSRRLSALGIQDGVAIEMMGQEQETTYRRVYADVEWEEMVDASDRLHYDPNFPLLRVAPTG